MDAVEPVWVGEPSPDRYRPDRRIIPRIGHPADDIAPMDADYRHRSGTNPDSRGEGFEASLSPEHVKARTGDQSTKRKATKQWLSPEQRSIRRGA
jgi:hypothetical protein